jgi:hypothetical protein
VGPRAGCLPATPLGSLSRATLREQRIPALHKFARLGGGEFRPRPSGLLTHGCASDHCRCKIISLARGNGRFYDRSRLGRVTPPLESLSRATADWERWSAEPVDQTATCIGGRPRPSLGTTMLTSAVGVLIARGGPIGSLLTRALVGDKRMDQLALIFVVALVALNCCPVDWKYDARSALIQIRVVSCGLILLYVYLIVRVYVR